MNNWAILVVLVVLAVMLGRFAIPQKDGLLKRPNPIDLASDDAKEILTVMNTDNKGKVTKEAWMKFMSAEFDRLNTDRSGAIDPRKLQMTGRPPGPRRSADLGK